MKLSQLEVGKRAKVVNVSLPAAAKQRLSNVGLTAGVDITVIRIAPLGDPIEISLRNFCLAIRRETANAITVRVYE